MAPAHSGSSTGAQVNYGLAPGSTDLLRAFEPAYPVQLPGSSRRAAEAMAARQQIAERIEAELAELSLPRDGWPDLDPSSVGSLLRGLDGVGLVSFGRV